MGGWTSFCGRCELLHGPLLPRIIQVEGHLQVPKIQQELLNGWKEGRRQACITSGFGLGPQHGFFCLLVANTRPTCMFLGRKCVGKWGVYRLAIAGRQRLLKHVTNTRYGCVTGQPNVVKTYPALKFLQCDGDGAPVCPRASRTRRFTQRWWTYGHGFLVEVKDRFNRHLYLSAAQRMRPRPEAGGLGFEILCWFSFVKLDLPSERIDWVSQVGLYFVQESYFQLEGDGSTMRSTSTLQTPTHLVSASPSPTHKKNKPSNCKRLS